MTSEPITTDPQETFIDACRFARVVETSEGPALLIGGHVIHLRSSDPEAHTDAIAKALRSHSSGFSIASGGTGAGAPATQIKPLSSGRSDVTFETAFKNACSLSAGIAFKGTADVELPERIQPSYYAGVNAFLDSVGDIKYTTLR